MSGDFSAVYVRLMQGALIAQLSRDILGEAKPAALPSGGGSPEPSRNEPPHRRADPRPGEGGAIAGPRRAEAGPQQQAGAVSSPPAAAAAAARRPSDVVPEQLEPAMREAADERPAAAAAADTVQRLRLAPAASLTLAGLPRPLNPSGERDGSPQATAMPADPQPARETGQVLLRQPAPIAGAPPGSPAGPGAGAGDATTGTRSAGDAPASGIPAATTPAANPLPASPGAAFATGPHGQAATPDGLPILHRAPDREGGRAGPGGAAASDAAVAAGIRGPAGDGAGPPQTAGIPSTSRAPALLSPAEAALLPSGGTISHAAEGIDAIRTSSVGGAPAVTGEAFLAAIAAMGNRPDQAVSRDMLAAVILNAAMIPGWPFPRAIENPAHAADARRAAGQLAAAGAEEFKLTPEEMIAYLTSIGANARLLKALQDLFARVEKKEAVQLMAWLVALTSALREIEKSVEDLLRKGTRLPEWAEDVADQVRKSLSRRHRYQI